MSYIKKEYREILEKADRRFTIPSSFKRFIKENELKHNLIIKSKGNHCICTNCKYEFISKKKVNEYGKCPNCKQNLLIKSGRLKEFAFRDNLQLLDMIEDTYILRTFELYSVYKNFNVHHYITEYMRTIIKENEVKDFVTNQVHNHMGYMYIAHYQKFTNWRLRNYRWSYRDVIGMVSPYNLKYLLRHTDLKYSQLDKFIAKVGYIDFVDYFRGVARYPSFEMLVKMKLYNLAIQADKFTTGKTFQEIFGVPKTFYNFMKKHNMTYEQLKVLRVLQKEDIKLINKLVGFSCLKELSRFVNIEKAYYKVLKCNNIYYEQEYLDYLRACYQMDYDMKDSKILYPNNLQKEHDKIMKLLEVVRNEANDRLIKERATILKDNVYSNQKYIVFPANSIESLVDESKQMNNCVKTYAEKFALGDCDLYFMRELDRQNKSLVTVEVRNGVVVQSRAKNNSLPNEEQQKFLNIWQQKILCPKLI